MLVFGITQFQEKPPKRGFETNVDSKNSQFSASIILKCYKIGPRLYGTLKVHQLHLSLHADKNAALKHTVMLHVDG